MSDLATWLGQTIADDDARALLVVDSANGLVLDATPGSSTWGGTWPSVASTVALGAAARAWVNPTGAQRQAQSTGPFSDDRSWAEASGILLTDDEKDTLAGLAPPAGGGIPGMGSFRVVAPAGTSPSGGSRQQIQQYDGDSE